MPVNGLISHRITVSTLVTLLLLATVSISFVINFLPSTHSFPTYGQAQTIATGQGFPVQVAVGSDGTVYWANQFSGTILKLPPGAGSPTILVSSVSYAQGIGVDAAGNVYYDEYMAGVVYKLPAGSTTPQALATGLDHPNFMSVDAAGDVYFITGQTCGNKIAEYNAATATVSTTITAAQLDGVFIDPSGDLYFVTCGDQQIERLPKGASTPQVIFTWTGSSKPEGIAVDSAGNVFFTIYGESVQVLPAGSSTPTVLASVSSFTDGYAHQMALDPCGNAYFIDSYEGNVWKIPKIAPACVPSYGPSQVLVTGQGYPISIGVDGAGSVYWANQADGRMFKLPRGSSVPTLLLSGLQNVQGLSVDAAGNVYYDEYFGGTLNELPVGTSTPQVLMTGLDFPNFMTVDRGGSSVYFVTGQTCGDKIVKFDLTSHALTTILTAPSPHDTDHGFDGLFINSLGDLYYSTCDYLTINRLPKGSSTPQVIMTVNTRPEGIAVDNAGNVFFTLYYQSVDMLPVGSSAPIILATGSTLHQLALDSDDNVYYTDSAGGKIWRIPVATVVTSPVTTPVTMCSTTTVVPWGITVSTDKNVYGPSDTVQIAGSVSGGPSCYCPCDATCTCTFAGNIIVQLEIRNDLQTVHTKTLILSPSSSIRPYSDSFSLSYALESGDYQIIARASYTGQMTTLMVSGGVTLTEPPAYPPVEARSSFRLEGTATTQIQTSTTSTPSTSVTSTMPVIHGAVYWVDLYNDLHPLAWAQVAAVGQNGVGTVTSSHIDGTYMMYLAPGTYNMTVSLDPDYRPESTTVTVSALGLAIDFTLQPLCTTCTTTAVSPTTYTYQTTVTQTSTVLSTTTVLTTVSTVVTSGTTTTLAGLQMQVVSNSTVSNLVFDSTRGLLNFTVSGPVGTSGFFDATVTKSLLSGQPVVLIDGAEHSASVNQDANFWYIHVTYPHSQHHVTIGGSNTVPEFPSFLLFAALLTILLVVLGRKPFTYQKREEPWDRQPARHGTIGPEPWA